MLAKVFDFMSQEFEGDEINERQLFDRCIATNHHRTEQDKM
jgi:hypothetical protein